jgi:hypothetical protein
LLAISSAETGKWRIFFSGVKENILYTGPLPKNQITYQFSLALWKSTDALVWTKINDSLPQGLLDVIS